MCKGNYEWPKDMPGKCPLDGSEPADGLLYRIVYSNPPNANDFLRTKDDPRQKAIMERFHNGRASNVDKCKSFGTSHFIKRSTCERIVIHKHRIRKMDKPFIAAVELAPVFGCMKQTGDINRGHVSVWFQAGASPWKKIQEITEVDLGGV